MTADGATGDRPPTATLLLSCADRPGIVATVADFVYRHGGNILHADQHTDAEEGIFFQRVEFALDGLTLSRDELPTAFEHVAVEFGMRVELRYSVDRPRVALLMSREPHCMYDLLARWRSGELPVEVPLVISNHPDHRDAATHFGVAFHHLPVTAETKADQEQAALQLLRQDEIDLVVLARYMQILSPEFVAEYQQRIINIHHSFLPAFVGSRPYQQAHQRGVKIVGVTADYVTASSTKGRSSTKTSYALITETRCRTSFARDATSRRSCWLAPCLPTWRAGFWSTATRPSCSADASARPRPL